jgi:hypothetical protein
MTHNFSNYSRETGLSGYRTLGKKKPAFLTGFFSMDHT